MQVSSSHQLCINVSNTFMEMALATSSSWSAETMRFQPKDRGRTAPYRIRNHTGSAVQIWSNSERGKESITVLQHGQSIDWRFDDWKSLREVGGTDVFPDS